MLKLTHKTTPQTTTATVTMTLSEREKSRVKVQLDDGRDAGIFLPRGETLRHGDCLVAESGEMVRVVAANESVSVVDCDDSLLLARACYHLGNRHVSLQIEPGRLSYLHDHVLDEMLRGIGLAVTQEEAPFEPEAGAYHSHAATHDHSQSHDHHRH